MKLKHLLINLILLIYSLTVVTYSHTSDSTVDTSLLWEISSENNPNISYLFGTHHLISGKFIDTINTLKEKIINAKEVYLEADVLNFDTNEVMNKTELKKGEYYIYPSAEDSVIVYEYVSEKLTVATYKFFSYKPFFAALVLEFIDIMEGPDKSSKNSIGIDLYIEKQALKNSQKLSFFETPVEQMSFITDSIPINIQTNYLIQSIKGSINEKKMKFKRIDSCYKSLSIDCIAENSNLWYGNDPFSRTLMMYRNQRWMDKIITSIENNSTFIAVGALHLVGEDGLIELLRREGYTVKPVKLN